MRDSVRQTSTTKSWSSARRFVTVIVATALASIWVQAIASLLGKLHAAPSLAAAEWTAATALAVAVGVFLLPRRRAAILAAAAAGAVSVEVVEVRVPGSGLSALAVPIVAVAATWGAAAIGERLPGDVDTVIHRRRVVAMVWAVVALVSVVQTARRKLPTSPETSLPTSRAPWVIPAT
jgi:hypothetical protein